MHTKTNQTTDLFQGAHALIATPRAHDCGYLIQALKRMGATWTIATSATRALEIFSDEHQSDRPISLIFMAQDMDGASGPQILTILQKLRPDQPFESILLVPATNPCAEQEPAAKKFRCVLPTPLCGKNLCLLLHNTVNSLEPPYSYDNTCLSWDDMPPQQVPEPAPLPKQQPRALHRILLVEDIPANRLVVRKYLESADMDVVEAENGQIAVSEFTKGDIDLVLMDLEMPVMDGLSATTTIRTYEQERNLPPVPVVALTAHALPEYKVQCKQAGCTGFLSKPVRKKTLLETLYTFLPSRSTAPTPDQPQTAQAASRETSPAAPHLLPPPGSVVHIDPTLTDLLPEFLEELAEQILQMSTCLGDSNYEDLQRLAHGYKGASASYELTALSALFARVQKAAETKDLLDAAETLSHIELYLENVSIQPSPE